MKNYFLFVDTETSGLPKRWDQPYSLKGNWPFSIQIAWIIFDKNGVEIKRENYYINEKDFSIDPSALKVHGITHQFLEQNGQRRKKVMNKLAYDIKKYDPILVGHFIELDFHMLSADFYRSGIYCPLDGYPLFCTMLASKQYVENPRAKFLRLSELYTYLFDQSVSNIHNAIVDVEITAASFFELVRRGDINDQIIDAHQSYFAPQKPTRRTENRWGMLILFLLILLLIVFTCYERQD
ncbi:3'-5' exonuclease [Sphingobacterium pedocola]|uniref:3'-5' exonuclease n=1 Tax=Sphingobacterium pedocola TaxID=2082722 RepID=UPI0018C92410|nr:3'-5' exonuclease [Sphingobacterium pedocola]